MGSNLTAVDLDGKTPVSVCTGNAHTCVIFGGANAGTLSCWGQNDDGRLGFDSAGADQFAMGASLPVVNLGAGKLAKSVSCGGFFTCVVLDDDTMKCFGDNQFGLAPPSLSRQTSCSSMSPGPALPYLPPTLTGPARNPPLSSPPREHPSLLAPLPRPPQDQTTSLRAWPRRPPAPAPPLSRRSPNRPLPRLRLPRRSLPVRGSPPSTVPRCYSRTGRRRGRRASLCGGEVCVAPWRKWRYRGTSLIRNRPPPRTTIGP
ncbi:hypothetical protein T484DRAFT_3462259 [Baffinella frigidus]|nr:hypothetical protein T484DRAFT_3462259 [Cryptophyta sp. CCMP2293]